MTKQQILERFQSVQGIHHLHALAEELNPTETGRIVYKYEMGVFGFSEYTARLTDVVMHAKAIAPEA